MPLVKEWTENLISITELWASDNLLAHSKGQDFRSMTFCIEPLGFWAFFGRVKRKALSSYSALHLQLSVICICCKFAEWTAAILSPNWQNKTFSLVNSYEVSACVNSCLTFTKSWIWPQPWQHILLQSAFNKPNERQLQAELSARHTRSQRVAIPVLGNSLLNVSSAIGCCLSDHASHHNQTSAPTKFFNRMHSHQGLSCILKIWSQKPER